jgi:hypothetical protein
MNNKGAKMKKITTITTISAVLLTLNFSVIEASVAGKSAKYITRKITGEAVEQGAKKSFQEASKKIGKKGAQKIFRKAGSEGLDFVARYGDDGAKFVMRYGKSGARIASTEGAERVFRLAGRYGDDVIKVAHKHPGTGLKIVEELGETGLKIAKHSDSLTVNQTLRYLPEMTEKGLRSKYVGAVEREGAGLFQRAGRWVADNPFKTAGLGAGLYFVIDPEGFAGHINKGAVPVAKEVAKTSAEAAGTVIKELGKGAGEGAGSFFKELVPQWAITTGFFMILIALFIRISKGVSWIKNFFKKLFRKKVPEKKKEEDFKTSEQT